MKRGNISVFIPHLGCPHQCSFCNQKTITGQVKAPSPEEVDHVLFEAVNRLGTCPEQTEIAFFGGSFTAVDAQYRTALLQTAYEYVERYHLRGIRISTRPDCIDERILDELCQYGVTSVELGAQSMDDRVLQMNQRGHTAEDVRFASRRIRQRGIELGLQMMTGLYGQTDDSARQTAAELAELLPDTVRIYPTVVLEGTELDRLRALGEYVPQTLEQAVELCGELLMFFESRGIPVIKLGLHASQEVEQQKTGGAYHPAFRELCESRIYLNEAKKVLLKAPKTDVIYVAPNAVSKMAGQHRRNLLTLEQLLGHAVKVRGLSECTPYQVKISCCESENCNKSEL
ncbi:MAG: elongator complex protein 3 [Massiliimalia sp.]|jgi:histone acetyltransferase (RNA polymerase elongator complex component)